MKTIELLDENNGSLSSLPKLVISQEDMDKIFGYTLSSGREINGRGIVNKIGNDFNVSDIFMIPQSGNAAHVKEDEEVLHKVLFEKFKDDLGKLTKLNFQFHSHPAGVYFSEVDRENARQLGISPLISMVVNKRFEIYCRLDIFDPVDISILLPVVIKRKISAETMKACREEVEKNDLSFFTKIRKKFDGIFPRKIIKDEPAETDINYGNMEYSA